jgi:hypothetical protein
MGTIQLSPPVAPFQRIKNPGENITINTAGKVLVIPTGDAVKLPNFNEYALNSNRLTIAESPFGGLKGAGSPDYAVGTIYTPTDGVYITDTSGTNSTKTMTAGKLKELSLLTVNTTAKTISEEFIIANLNTANGTLQSIDPCNDHTGWAVAGTFGTGVSFSSDGSTVTVTGTCDASGYLIVEKTLSSPVDLTNYPFAIFNLKSSRAGTAMLGIGSSNSNYSRWSNKTCTALTANTQAAAVLPIKAPGSSTSTISNPNIVNGSPNWAAVAYLRVGYFNATYASQEVTLTLYDISADVGKAAYVEIQVPDQLVENPSITLQCWDGSAYQTCRVCKLNSTFSDVSTTPANVKTLDTTKLDDIYGSTLGRGVFPKGVQSATVTGNNSLTMTFSANKGTKYRIGKMVMLPPSDSGRTNFNKIRLKLIITYANSGATSYEFEDSLNASYGLQNMTKPFLALYDPAKSLIDFYLFTHRPKALTRKKNDSGEIYEMVLYPGNGSIFHGQITYADLTADGDSNLIPNCLEAAVEGSITKFLAPFQAIVEPSTIDFITTGQTFAPVIVTTGSPTILWTFSDGTTDATATPSKNFGTVAARRHTLKVTPWSGLLYINVGYNGDDGGETPGEGTNLTAVTQQNVRGIFNLSLATALQKIACSRNPITFLDLSNLSALTTVEAYSASSLASVTLLNNTALKRLCIESCNVRNLDLSNVPAIEDLRLSLQSNGHIGIIWSGSTYANLWHLCARDVIHDNVIPTELMPVLQDLDVWSTGISGSLTLVSPALVIVRIWDTSLTSITFPETYPANLVTILLNNNLFSESVVDYLLHYFDTGGLDWRTLSIYGNVAPSADGLAHKTHLVNTLHWTVTTD